MSENWRYQKISILKFAPPTKNDNFLGILAKNLTNFDPKNSIGQGIHPELKAIITD